MTDKPPTYPPYPHVTGIQGAYWPPVKDKSTDTDTDTDAATATATDTDKAKDKAKSRAEAKSKSRAEAKSKFELTKGKKDYLGLSRLIFGLMGVDEVILKKIFVGLSDNHKPEIKRWDCGFFGELNNHDPQIKNRILSQFVDVADINKVVADRNRNATSEDIALGRLETRSVEWECRLEKGKKLPNDFATGISRLYYMLQNRMYRQNSEYKTIIVAAPLSDNPGIDERKYSCHFLDNTLSDQFSAQEALATIAGLQLLNNGNYAPEMENLIENSALSKYVEIEGELTLKGKKTPKPFLSTVGSEYENSSIKIREKNKYLRVKVDLPKSLFIRKKMHEGNDEESDLHNFCYMMSIIMSHSNCFFYTLKIPASPSAQPDSGGPLIYLPRYWSDFVTSTYTKQHPLEIKHDPVETEKKKKKKKKKEVTIGWKKVSTDWGRFMVRLNTLKNIKLIYRYDVGHKPDRLVRKIFGLARKPLPERYSLIYLDRIIVPDLGGKQVPEFYIYFVLAFNHENKIELIALEYNTASMEMNEKVLDPKFECSDSEIDTGGAQQAYDPKHWVGLDKFWHVIFSGFKVRGLKNVGAVVASGVNEHPFFVDSFFPDALKLSLIRKQNESIKFMRVHSTKRAKLMSCINNIYDAPTQGEAKVALNNYNNYFQNEFYEIDASWPPHLADVEAFIAKTEEFKVDIKDKKARITLILDAVHKTLRAKINKSNQGRTPDEWSYTKAVWRAINKNLERVNGK
ncbi:MAG: hypothetical protein V7717_05320 [Porticoccaceae bacterium]